MARKTLTLTHDLDPGWRAPWVDAVLKSKALARRCTTCGKVSFVPQKRCVCGQSQGSWVFLPGTATLQMETSGRDGHFALVRFDGADTPTIVRLVNWQPGKILGRLIAPVGELPALLLAPLDAGDAENTENAEEGHTS